MEREGHNGRPGSVVAGGAPRLSGFGLVSGAALLSVWAVGMARPRRRLAWQPEAPSLSAWAPPDIHPAGAGGRMPSVEWWQWR